MNIFTYMYIYPRTDIYGCVFVCKLTYYKIFKHCPFMHQFKAHIKLFSCSSDVGSRSSQYSNDRRPCVAYVFYLQLRLESLPRNSFSFLK